MDIFTKFKGTIKIKPIKIDNEVFQLHYRATALMIAISGALVASKQHFGDPIECITKDDVPAKIMNNYCWVHSTFTVANACNNTSTALTPHPCIDTAFDSSLDNMRANFKGDWPEKEKIYHAYYQWVYFVLFFQALLFYAPHFFWKATESQLMASLTTDMKNPIKSMKSSEKFNNAIAYLSNPDRYAMHNDYMRNFFKFELANLINIVIQCYMVNWFLHGSFANYGWELLTRSMNDVDEIDVDPTDRVFPKMTKCTFRRFGPSGDLNRYDALCILPLNILNEKIYLIMWFWFVFLTMVTLGWIAYRIAIMSTPRLRYWNLMRRANYTNTRQLKYVVNECPPGTWFLLSMMCSNMSPNAYSNLVSALHESLFNYKAKNLAAADNLAALGQSNSGKQQQQAQNKRTNDNHNYERKNRPGSANKKHSSSKKAPSDFGSDPEAAQSKPSDSLLDNDSS